MVEANGCKATTLDLCRMRDFVATHNYSCLSLKSLNSIVRFAVPIAAMAWEQAEVYLTCFTFQARPGK
jgi:hypothetical protein